MRRPVRISSFAAATPAIRASRCVPPAPGMIPSRTSVSPISAVSAAIRMSQASASSSPPPNATPFTAAMVGRGNAASASMSALISPRKTRVSSSVQVRRSFEIRARRERLVALARQHQHAEVGAPGNLTRQVAAKLGQLRDQRPRQRVRRARPVERHEQRAIVTFDP